MEKPQTGDIVIWDMEPESASSIFWVRTHGRGGDTHVFEGTDAWTRARTTAEGLAGPNGVVWRRDKDGHFERLVATVE